MTLLLSIAALLLGPLLYGAMRRWPAARRIFDALVIAAIAVIVFLHIIPEAWEQAGYLAVAILVAGALFPMLLERLFRSAHETAHRAIVVIAAAGLLLHAVIDGLALLPATGSGVALGIILHRIPVGMAVWWIVRPNLGMKTAIAMFAAIVLATSIGYFAGEGIFDLANPRVVALLQAFVAGSLAHVAVFGVRHDHDSHLRT